MFKKMLAIAAVASLSMCAVAPATADWDIDARNAQVDETNFILNGNCSGTLISVEFDLVLTAYHCIDSYVKTRTFSETDEDGIVRDVQREDMLPVSLSQVRYVDYQRVASSEFVGDIVAHQQTRDLALIQLRADAPSDTAAPLLPEDSDVKRSETVWIVGNPLGLDASIGRGTIGSVSRSFRVPWANNQEVPLIQFDAAGEPGSSGGALYNDSGQLIGVVIAGFSKQMFAVPIGTVRDFLRLKGWGDEILGDPLPEIEIENDACC